MNTMSSTKFHHLLYNINILGEELHKYLCFCSNPINYLYLSMYMYVVLNYEINMFKLDTSFATVIFRTRARVVRNHYLPYSVARGHRFRNFLPPF